MAEHSKSPDYKPSGFFVLRTPLFPFKVLEQWGEGLAAPEKWRDRESLGEALAADRELLRSRLRELIRRPEVREAFFVASPVLDGELAAGHRDPARKKGRRAEEAAVRYLQRMASRPTPFGLFAGCSVGHLGSETRLALESLDKYGRHTRLDMDYLFALTADLQRDRELRCLLAHYPNSSLYHAAGQFRYIESRLRGRARSHHLVAVDAADYLARTIDRARQGARVTDLVKALVADDPDGADAEAEADAEEFIHELIDRQILVSDLCINVTGIDPLEDLIDQLSRLPPAASVLEVLSSVRAQLASLDAGGLGLDPDRYCAIASALEALPTPVDLPRLFQVDLTKPESRLTLGPSVLAEIDRGIEILKRFAAPAREDPLSQFRQDFLDRYSAGQLVPLMEVLDEESGIGFERSRAAAAEASPLLEGFAFPASGPGAAAAWGPQSMLLFRRLEQALADGSRVIELRQEELVDLPASDLPLPDAFHVMAVIAAATEEAFDRGDFQLNLSSLYGPSGARLLGRFCHSDDRLRQCVEEHLREEEALEPDAVFAEVVHLPEGRIGNVIARPILRAYELPYLGRSGAPRERQIPVTDLLVSVEGQEIVLYSASLGRRVIPSLTTAHSLHRGNVSVYRFLGLIQNQNALAGLGWSWGALELASFLPRVICGRIVLARARWRVPASEIRLLVKGSDEERYQAIQQWRDRRGLPRRAVLVDGDNELFVDFHNILSMEAFLALARQRPELILSEMFPEPGELYASGSEGRFVHEMLIPYVRHRAVARRRNDLSPMKPICRTFPPGTEWLYAKLYTGTSTGDQLLREVIAPIVRQAMMSGAVDHWFFIRYGDPHWHLRVRFHGDPKRLREDVLPALQAAVEPMLAERKIWRLQLDTYERELERYGGAEGIPLAERLFHVDSEAVLEILGSLQGDEGADARWLLALRGLDKMISDLGFQQEEKLILLQGMQQDGVRRFGIGAEFRQQMADRLRSEAPRLEAALGQEAPEALAPGFAAIRRRSMRLAPIVGALQAKESAGDLTVSLRDMAVSFCHMFVNRLVRSEGPAHELLLYDFLLRQSQSSAARLRKSKSSAAK